MFCLGGDQEMLVSNCFGPGLVTLCTLEYVSSSPCTEIVVFIVPNAKSGFKFGENPLLGCAWSGPNNLSAPHLRQCMAWPSRNASGDTIALSVLANVFLYCTRNQHSERTNDSQGRKAMRAMSTPLDGNAEQSQG